MTAPARCEFSDLPTNTCAHCLGHTDPEQQDAKEHAALLASGKGWIPAQFPGRCVCCQEPFEEGTPIRRAFWTGWHGPCCTGGAS